MTNERAAVDLVAMADSLDLGLRLCVQRLKYEGVIDLKQVRENPDHVRNSQVARGEDPSLVDQLLAADETRRSAIQKADELRGEQKAFGKKIGQMTGQIATP